MTGKLQEKDVRKDRRKKLQEKRYKKKDTRKKIQEKNRMTNKIRIRNA